MQKLYEKKRAKREKILLTPVERAIVYCFKQMPALNFFGIIQVGNGS